MDNAMRQDEFDLNFEDTRAFGTWRYNGIINLISEAVTKEDLLVVQEHRTWQDIGTEIPEKIVNPKSSAALTQLMSAIQPFPRSIATLNGTFITAVAHHNVQFDFLWRIVYLNLRSSYTSTDKLKRTAECLGNLERQIKNLSLRHTSLPDTEERASFPCTNLAFQQNNRYFGREAGMQEIINNLSQENGNLDLCTYNYYKRRGPGETEITLQYGYDDPSGFEAIFWIQCDTSPLLRQSFTDVAVCLNLPSAERNCYQEGNLLTVHKRLKLTKKTDLLIFDNAEQEETLGYWPVRAKGTTLITSRRCYNSMKDKQRMGDRVKPFNEQQRFDLLILLLWDKWQDRQKRGTLIQLEIVTAKILLKKIGRLALDIQQASISINNPESGGSTIACALELLSSNAQDLPEPPTPKRSEMIYVLDPPWDMNLSILTPNSRNFLSVLELFSPDSTEVDLFLHKNTNTLDGKLSFIQERNPRYANDSQSAIADAIAPPLLEAAIQELLVKGFIRRDNRVISVNRIVQEAMTYHNMEDLQESYDAVTRLVNEAFPKTRYLYETADYESYVKPASSVLQCRLDFRSPPKRPVLSFHPDRRKYTKKIKRGLPGFVNGSKVSAIADTGSAQNIISAGYASAMKLRISPGSSSFQLGNSKSVQAIGTVMLDWSFAEKPQETYKLLFHVLPTCIYDVIIGRPFLNITETLSKYRRRLRDCVFSVFNVLRFGFLGDTCQVLEGTLGETTGYKHSALAGLDTGAECNIMSEAYAHRHGYRISRDYVPTYLQFADGSYQQTEGQVHTFWTFGSGMQIPITFEVLKDCVSDVIIGEEIIYNYSLYENFAPDIREIESTYYSYELAPFGFFKGWQRPKAKTATKHISKDRLAREAEMLRSQNWNISTDYGKFADSTEKLTEKTRRESFKRCYPLLEDAPVQRRVRRAPNILPPRANRHGDVARDDDGYEDPPPQEQIVPISLRRTFQKLKSLVV